MAAEDHIAGTGIRVPPPLIFVAGFLVGLGVELLAPVGGPSSAVRIAAAVVGVAGWAYFDGAATRVFHSAGTSVLPFGDRATTIVTDGPYRFTRNPMYVGMAVLHAALAIALSVIWALATLVVVIVVIDRMIIAREEVYLARKFGEPYRTYMTRVRRWL